MKIYYLSRCVRTKKWNLNCFTILIFFYFLFWKANGEKTLIMGLDLWGPHPSQNQSKILEDWANRSLKGWRGKEEEKMILCAWMGPFSSMTSNYVFPSLPSKLSLYLSTLFVEIIDCFIYAVTSSPNSHLGLKFLSSFVSTLLQVSFNPNPYPYVLPITVCDVEFSDDFFFLILTLFYFWICNVCFGK